MLATSNSKMPDWILKIINEIKVRSPDSYQCAFVARAIVEDKSKETPIVIFANGSYPAIADLLATSAVTIISRPPNIDKEI